MRVEVRNCTGEALVVDGRRLASGAQLTHSFAQCTCPTAAAEAPGPRPLEFDGGMEPVPVTAAGVFPRRLYGKPVWACVHKGLSGVHTMVWVRASGGRGLRWLTCCCRGGARWCRTRS
jgi:hypothetical protein